MRMVKSGYCWMISAYIQHPIGHTRTHSGTNVKDYKKVVYPTVMRETAQNAYSLKKAYPAIMSWRKQYFNRSTYRLMS